MFTKKKSNQKMEPPKLEVKLISRESIKPSIPTPSHLKNFKLSYLDQILPIIPPFLTSGLLFYNTNFTKTQAKHHITTLKFALSKALINFYPLAGIVKQSTITCNDQGIPFFVTEINCTLSNAILNLSLLPQNIELACKFLPPRDSLGIIKLKKNKKKPISKVVHLALQINVFTCGGIAIGWYDIHKFMDGMSSATFFKYWAALSSETNNHHLVMPDFSSTVTAFPPSPKAEVFGFGGDCEGVATNTMVVKSFVFRNKAISNLKARAASEVVPNPSSYEALAGCIWEQLLLVSKMRQVHKEDNTDTDSGTVLQVTIDMRSCMNPPLSKGSIGNLINTAIARANKCASLPKLTAEIHTSVAQMKEEIKEYNIREKGVQALQDNYNKVSAIIEHYKEKGCNYKVVSWCKLGFTELDFGFGKPIWMVPTDGIISPLHKNLIILNNYSDKVEEGGVEGWMFLEEEDMKLLESNQEFLSVASPFNCKNLM